MLRRNLLFALLVGSLAVTLAGCGNNSESITSPVDLSPPQAPTNLHSMNDAATSRDWLVWTPSASVNVASYEVYSSENPSGMNNHVATLDGSSSNFVLPIVDSNTTEYYRVRAIGTNNVPSAFSGVIQVDRGAFDGLQPSTGPGKGFDGGF